MTATIKTDTSRSLRLKAATHATHDALDKRIMAADIFANRMQFAKFLRVQYRFHRDIDALYSCPNLTTLMPSLEQRRRLLKIANDLSDLGQQPPPPQPPRFDSSATKATALGWLYVAEGSNLGATILYKMAKEKLGLNASLGARHLAAHPDGAARYWREFTHVLDSVVLDEQEEAKTLEAAKAAFATVAGYAEDELFNENAVLMSTQHEA